jgi:opacity protein-like surface antigen
MYTSIGKSSMPAAVLAVWCTGIASPAWAQITVSSSVGISGEGQPTVGAAIGTSLGVVRPELELGWSRHGIDRGAATPSKEQRRDVGAVAGAPTYLPAVTADVSTLMVRVAVPVTHGRTFNPFGSVGAGFARAMRPPPPGESLQRTDTQFGIEVGGGTTTRLTDRIGLRTAATYYKVLGPPGNFHGAPGTGIVYTNVLREFSLIRVSVGIDIRLSGSKTGQSQ